MHVLNQLVGFSFVLLLLAVPRQTQCQILDSLTNAYEVAETDSARLALLNEMVRYTYLSDRALALEYAQTYLGIANESGTPRQKAKGLNFIGMIHYLEDEIDQAIQHYLLSLEQFEAAGDTLYMGILYNNIAASYQLREKQQETIDYYLQALHYVDLAGDRDWVANINLNLGRPYKKLQQYDKALDHIQTALAYYEEIDSDVYRAYAWHAIGEIKLEQRINEEAAEAGFKALALMDVEFDPSIEIRIRSMIGTALTRLDQPQKAEPHLNRGLELSRQLGSNEDKLAIYIGLREYHEAIGNFQDALLFFDTVVQIRDSLFNIEKDIQLTDALTRYQTERKQRQIDQLEATTKLQELRIAQSRRERWIFFGIVIGLGLFTALILYLLWQNKRARTQLEIVNAEIAKALEEKDLLLREIHHRVKNNLQIVSSLLNLQSRTIQDAGAAQAIRDSQNRVRSMAILHQNLYQQEHATAMNVAQYVDMLSNHLMDSYGQPTGKVTIESDVEEMILDVDLLVPLGLILNELLTNALKYAFPGDEEGKIDIRLRGNGENLEMVVADDGCGMAQGTDLQTNENFGFRMIRAFTAKLKGNMQIQSEQGTVISLSIPNYKSHIA
jgi:two-component sensor histidine kinase